VFPAGRICLFSVWDSVKNVFLKVHASETILRPELSTAHLGIEERFGD
jgi:hypothetical protein